VTFADSAKQSPLTFPNSGQLGRSLAILTSYRINLSPNHNRLKKHLSGAIDQIWAHATENHSQPFSSGKRIGFKSQALGHKT